jgi:nucleoside-diphosphate-sugar epimerase
MRPNPGFGFATQKAELERLAGEWVDDHPGTTLTILRPAVPMDEEETGFLSTVLGVRAPVATGDREVPVQFVHLDDLADAIVHATVNELDGVFNVAADHWLSASEAGEHGRGPYSAAAPRAQTIFSPSIRRFSADVNAATRKPAPLRQKNKIGRDAFTPRPRANDQEGDTQ